MALSIKSFSKLLENFWEDDTPWRDHGGVQCHPGAWAWREECIPYAVTSCLACGLASHVALLLMSRSGREKQTHIIKIQCKFKLNLKTGVTFEKLQPKPNPFE